LPDMDGPGVGCRCQLPGDDTTRPGAYRSNTESSAGCDRAGSPHCR
jgi:hypothetical protein